MILFDRPETLGFLSGRRPVIRRQLAASGRNQCFIFESIASVLDNGGVKPGLGIFGHDFAKVKFLSFVTRSDQSVPDLDEWMQNNDAKAKKATLQTLVSEPIRTRGLTEVDRVRDNVPVDFGDTGLILYEAEEIPEAFTWTFLAIRSSRDLREAARDVNEILREPSFGAFSKDLLGLMKAGSTLVNPAYAAGIEVAKFVAQTGARRLMKKGDRELGAVDRQLHPARTLSAGHPGKP